MASPEQPSGLNPGYVGLLLEQYLENPHAVDPAWRKLFEDADASVLATLPGLARLELGRQRRLVLALVERGIPERLGAERVEMRRQMPVRANGVDERHRRCNATEKLCVDSGRGRRSGRLGRSARRIDRRCSLG